MSEATPYETAREQMEKRVDDFVEEARSGATKAAEQIAGTKRPVETLADSSIRLSKVAHETADKLIRQHAKIAAASIDAAMGGFQAAAGASDVKDLMLSPARLMPENAARLAADARDVLDIMLGAGVEVREIAFDTVAELRLENETASGKPARSGARKPRRKTASKAKASRAAKAA